MVSLDSTGAFVQLTLGEGSKYTPDRSLLQYRVGPYVLYNELSKLMIQEVIQENNCLLQHIRLNKTQTLFLKHNQNNQID